MDGTQGHLLEEFLALRHVMLVKLAVLTAYLLNAPHFLLPLRPFRSVNELPALNSLNIPMRPMTLRPCSDQAMG